MRKGLIVLLTALTVGPGVAGAVPIIYSDEATFLSAAGSAVLEDFNSQTDGATFHTSPLEVGPFSLSMTGLADTGRNYIDAPPPQFSVFDVDGTTIANVLTKSGVSLFLTFDTAITAFGVSLASFNDDNVRTDILAAGTTSSPGPFTRDAVSFFGIVSDTSFTTVEFRGFNNDGFGMDNVWFTAASSVPEPAALGLMAIGLAGIGFARRKSA